MAASNPLLSLLRECVVRIDCDDEFEGSGFFIAPGEVLTCAHVVHDASRIEVCGSGWKSAAQVTEQSPDLPADSPDADFYPLPDIALLRYPEAERTLSELMVEWLRTPSWDDSRAFLEAHAEELLLSDAAEATLEHFLDEQPDQPELLRHMQILRDARAGGIGRTYGRIDAEVAVARRREHLREWVGKEDRGESLAFLRDNGAELLDPRSEHDLLEAALRQPETTALYTFLALLSLSRIGEAEVAYELLDRDPPIADDADLLRSAGDPETLALARLSSGLHEQDADSQLRHALAAAAARAVDEARQAIERCRQLLPSWERPDYVARLARLAEAHPEFAPTIASLESALITGAADERGRVER